MPRVGCLQMKLKKRIQNATLSFLERKYPGIRDIVNLLGKFSTMTNL